MKPSRRIFALIVAAWGAFAPAAHGQSTGTPAYPAKNVRIIVGLAPGGTTHVFTRILAQRLTEAREIARYRRIVETAGLKAE